MFYSAQRLDLFAWCVGLSWRLVGFRTLLESVDFHSFHCYVITHMQHVNGHVCMCVWSDTGHEGVR